MILFSVLSLPLETNGIMAMSLWEYAPALIAGLAMGGFYFGGLWLTLRHLIHTRQRALLLWVSFLVRASITLAVFYVIMGGNYLRLVACMLGFLLMRQILTWRLGPGRVTRRHMKKESSA